MKSCDWKPIKTFIFEDLKSLKTALSFVLIFIFTTIGLSTFEPYITEEETVYPGVSHIRYLNHEPLMEIHVVEIDNNAPEISFHVQSAHNQLRGRQLLHDMVDNFQEKNENCTVISAINADFFANHGIPINILIEDGFFKHSSIHRGAVLFEGLTPVFDIFQTRVNIRVGEEYMVFSHVNTLLPAQHPVLITSHYYQFPIEVKPGIFVVYQLEEDQLLPYKNYSLKLSRITGALSSLKKDELAVFLPNKNKVELIESNPDITIRITFLGKWFEDLTQATGGGPILVKNSENVVENQVRIEAVGTNFALYRHPRTAVGYSSRNDKIYFVVVDGRQAGYSMGINLYDLADFFIEYLYCDEALNLDGGGSTTLMVRDAVKNRVSDPSGPRSISTAILLCSTARGKEPAYLIFPEKELTVFPHTVYPLSIVMKDEYYHPLSFDISKVEWIIEPDEMGSVKEGVLQAGEIEQKGKIIALYNSIKAEMPLTVEGQGDLKVSTNQIEGYSGQVYPLELSFYGPQNNPVKFSLQNITLSDPSVIDFLSEEEVFLQRSGSGKMFVNLGSHSKELYYTIGKLERTIVDDFSDKSVSLPSISGQNYNEENTGVSLFTDEEGRNGLRIDYEFIGSGTSAIYIDVDYLLPEENLEYIGLNIKGDANRAWLRGVFEDEDKEKFLLDFTSNGPEQGITWTGWKELFRAYDDVMPYWSNPDAEHITFPLRLKIIYLVQPDPQFNRKGSIIIDNIFVDSIKFNRE